MPPENPGRRLEDLLVDPHETLDIELKEWLDIVGNNDHRAILAKSIIALANHGGGFIIIGFSETEQGIAPAANRPASLAGYTPDTVNSVVLAYAEPSFHCDVNIVSDRDGTQYPIIVVPGGHKVPIKARRDGPNGQTVHQNNYYIRRPGPRSEQPQTGAEWDALIRRCIANGREDLVNQIRSVLTGGPEGEAPPNEQERTKAWLESSLARWRQLIDATPAGSSARMPHGHFAFAYSLRGNLRELRGRELLDALDRAKITHTGWPEFWVPTRQGIQPYVHDGNVECWIARDEQDHGPAHSDFWRVSPDGRLFLIRGLQEDEGQPQREPGTHFDLTIPTWRVGEALLHAGNMAAEFGDPQAQITMVLEWSGLARRQLTHLEGRRMIWEGYTSQQDRFETGISVQADQVPGGLPELVGRVLRPLYELFDFFALPQRLVIEELDRMRQNRF